MNTSNKQTAVEWLVDELLSGKPLMPSLIEQAIAIEREQIVFAWERGQYIGITFPQSFIPNEWEQDAEQYYQETYGEE